METIIYVLIVNEPIMCWRPVNAKKISEKIYQLSPIDVPDDEEWEFLPGTIVECEEKVFSGGEGGLVAKRKIENV